MSYSPKPGDIGLTQIHGRVGWWIRVGQWLNGDGWHAYQHAFVVVESEKIVEAMPNGARLTDLARYDNYKSVVYLRCPSEYSEEVAWRARTYVGIGYSFADYFSLALHRFRISTPRLKRYIESSGHMICSQLADRAAELGGWNLFDDDRWHGDVTPGDLYELYGRMWAQEDSSL